MNCFLVFLSHLICSASRSYVHYFSKWSHDAPNYKVRHVTNLQHSLCSIKNGWCRQNVFNCSMPKTQFSCRHCVCSGTWNECSVERWTRDARRKIQLTRVHVSVNFSFRSIFMALWLFDIKVLFHLYQLLSLSRKIMQTRCVYRR